MPSVKVTYKPDKAGEESEIIDMPFTTSKGASDFVIRCQKNPNIIAVEYNKKEKP